MWCWQIRLQHAALHLLVGGIFSPKNKLLCIVFAVLYLWRIVCVWCAAKVLLMSGFKCHRHKTVSHTLASLLPMFARLQTL